MKVICKYSGVQLTGSSFKTAVIKSSHPMMEASLGTILSQLPFWREKQLSPTEARILFIAALKATELVEFRCPAKPEIKRVYALMEKAIFTLGWVALTAGRKTKLPRYIVDEGNKNLRNISLWFNELESVRATVEGNFSPTLVSRRQRREELLEHAIYGSSTSRNKRFYGILADWALTASGADSYKEVSRETCIKWREIFRLKDMEILGAKTEDIQELLTYMEKNLEVMESPLAVNMTLRHLRNILSQNTSGDIYDFLDHNVPMQFAMKDTLENPFKILTNSAGVAVEMQEHITLKTIASEAPTQKPERKDYASAVDFLRAISKWNVAERVRNLTLEAAISQENGDNEDV